MPTETLLPASGRRVRFDLLAGARGASSSLRWWPLVAIAGLLALWGASGRSLDSREAAVGLACWGEPTPFGQVGGAWDPTLLPGRVWPSLLWVFLFGDAGLPTPDAVLIPSALATLVTGLILARRAWATLGARAGAFAAACALGSLGLIERPLAFGFEPWTGLAIVAALDRVLGRSSDWVAGFWAAFAVLSGGWPALAVLILPVVVLGRQGSYLSFRLLAPPVAAFVAWSAWGLTVAPAVVWGEAIALPLKAPTSWLFGATVAAFAMPWTPLALLVAWPSARLGWEEPGRRLVWGWLQVAGVSALAGTMIPGLATAAFSAALAGLAITASAGLDGALKPEVGPGARRTLLAVATLLGLAWAAVAVPSGTYLAASVPYYRPAAIVAVALAIVTGAFALVGAFERRLGWTFGIVLGVALGIKLAHASIYKPEWDYRVGQGAWGRAIGQWVPPRWPIYVFNPWPADLAFATEHPFVLLASPKVLKYAAEGDPRPAFVLMQPAEFDHWPESAPPLLKVHTFDDGLGRPRLLARTAGPLTGADGPGE
jgi:hypothetical protein